MTQAEFLTWDQVREMNCGGLVAFGSHTMSHVSLTRLPSSELEYELACSKAELEDRIGMPVPGFAHPYGTVRDFSLETAGAVAAAGYSVRGRSKWCWKAQINEGVCASGWTGGATAGINGGSVGRPQ
jgi:peptidoglycan/xylan/chitin deacetylase (PgdA/CDA1 family)